MKNHYFKIIGPLLFPFLSFYINTAKAQSISYYPWRDMISIASNPSKQVWVNINIPTGETSTINTEISPMINLGFSSIANFYAGAGVNFDFVRTLLEDDIKLIKGYTATIGTRAYPFEKAHKVSINFDLSPAFTSNFKTVNLRAFLGIGYNFSK